MPVFSDVQAGSSRIVFTSAPEDEEAETIEVSTTGEQFIFDRRPAPESEVEIVEPEVVED